MAKKELVEKIVNLYSKLGGNMNNVLGSRSNITFLGTGKNPEPFTEMAINIEAVGALGKSKILKELESPMGYLTADKLNDIQAGKLYENLLKLDEFYNPRSAPANITDMATRTGDLDPKGLAALRSRFRNRENVDLDDIPPTVQTQDPNFIPIRADQYRDIFGKSPGLKNVDLPPPGSRGGADDIAAPFESAEETLVASKGSKLMKGLEEKLNALRTQKSLTALASTNRADVPMKRATAREFLVEALKDSDDLASGRTTLSDFISATDKKYVMEGGGGIAGDPIVLVEKYFGPRIAEAVPARGLKNDEIIEFTRRVLYNVEDAAGNKPDSPRFDRFTAKFVDEMADGGRVGYRFGKSVFKGIGELFNPNKKMFRSRDDVPTSTFSEMKGPITLADMQRVPPSQLRKIMRTQELGLYDETPEILAAGNLLERFTKVVGGKRVIDYERAEAILGTKLRGDETLDELFAIEFRTRPKAADGGRAGFMAGGIGKFTKAQVLIQKLKNTIKDSQGKTDELSVYVNETFPNFIKEIKANPKLAENENVWKTLGLDLPSDQRLVVHSDDTVDFFRQTEGPQNIAKVEAFMAKYPFLSREDALRIMKMEPEDQVLEITRLEVLNRRTKNAQGGLAKILEV